MKKFISLLCLSVVMSSVSAWADTGLILPKGFQVVAVNGTKANLFNNATLPKGVNQIAVRVAKDLGKSFDADMEYSDVYVLKFPVKGNETLELTGPRIKSVRDVRSFNNNPDLALIDSNGQEVDYEIDKLEKSGFQLLRNFEQELAVFNKTDSVAAMGGSNSSETVTEAVKEEAPSKSKAKTGTAKTTPKTPKSPATKNTQASSEKNMAEDMLKYWYEQADEETKNKFKKILSNEQ